MTSAAARRDQLMTRAKCAAGAGQRCGGEPEMWVMRCKGRQDSQWRSWLEPPEKGPSIGQAGGLSALYCVRGTGRVRVGDTRGLGGIPFSRCSNLHCANE